MAPATACVATVRRIGQSLTGLFPFGLATVALFTGLIVVGSRNAPGGYDGGSLDVAFLVFAKMWMLGFLFRCIWPTSRAAAAAEALALFLAVCLLSSLVAEVLALGGGDYIDPTLAAIDRTLVPQFEWRNLALGLAHHPELRSFLARCYSALDWQPLLYLGASLIAGRQRDLEALLNAWCIGLMACILPFHWLPARGPYTHYAIGRDAVPGATVSLPWDYAEKLEALRSGAIDTIGPEGVSGLVTIPSFHACAAVILGSLFWRFPLLRWPMMAVNGLMFAAAVPIGGHYFVDVIVGAAAGVLAISAACALERFRTGERGVPPPVDRPLPA